MGSNPDWVDSSGRHTGCLSDYGDLGIGQNIFISVQFVTYGEGFWIVRIENLATHERHDVAIIHNSNASVSDADVIVEESWFGDSPFVNPWVRARFYSLDFKYRDGAFWSHMPSNIGGGYGTTYIWEASNSGEDPCPGHYGITPYVTGNPYLWFMGTGGQSCSGNLYTGGGPSTAVTGIKDLTADKYLTSENGADCVSSNRTWVGQWEEWHIDDLGSSYFAYRGNNGKYLNRHSDNVLWEDHQGYNNLNA